MGLTIDVEDDGVVRVSVKGVIVGLIKSLSLVVDEETHPVPHIVVVMTSARDIPRTQDGARLVHTLHQYKRLLASHPLVRVVDQHDTLPQGMPAVRLPEEE